jgi:HAD domain in Swiss Army Knife RNA repair proteins
MLRPLLLIDVDGVISLFGADQTRHDQVVTALVDGIPHRLSRGAAAALRELAPTFECVWCTGWEERAGEHLPTLLDLPRGWSHIAFPDRPEWAAHWKLAGIDAHAGPRRPLAWIDDAHDAACREWAARRPGPTLLVETDPAVGLTGEHAAQLRRWAARLAT